MSDDTNLKKTSQQKLNKKKAPEWDENTRPTRAAIEVMEKEILEIINDIKRAATISAKADGSTVVDGKHIRAARRQIAPKQQTLKIILAKVSSIFGSALLGFVVNELFVGSGKITSQMSLLVGLVSAVLVFYGLFGDK